MPNMKDWVNHIIRRLTHGQVVPVEEEENEEEHDNWQEEFFKFMINFWHFYLIGDFQKTLFGEYSI